MADNSQFDPVEFGRVLGRLDSQDRQLTALFGEMRDVKDSMKTLIDQEQQREGAKKLGIVLWSFASFVIGIGFQYGITIVHTASTVTK